MAAIEWMTQAEYARARGVSREAVRKAVKAGRIALVNGKIDPGMADGQWDRNTRKAIGRGGSAATCSAELDRVARPTVPVRSSEPLGVSETAGWRGVGRYYLADLKDYARASASLDVQSRRIADRSIKRRFVHLVGLAEYLAFVTETEDLIGIALEAVAGRVETAGHGVSASQTRADIKGRLRAIEGKMGAAAIAVLDARAELADLAAKP